MLLSISLILMVWDVYGVALPEVQTAEPAGDAGNRYGSGTYVLNLLDGSILGISRSCGRWP